MIPPATDALEFLFVAWATGVIGGGAVTRLWEGVQPGHFKVVWIVSAILSLLAGLFNPAAFGLAVACVLTLASVYLKFDKLAGIVTATGSVILLAYVTSELGGLDLAGAGFALVSGLLLGSVTNAMLIGHWHLNQPRLSTLALQRLTWGLWSGIALFLVAAGTLVVAASPSGVAVAAAATSAAFTAFSGVLTAMVTKLVKTKSIMSATGILYLEVLLCLAAVFTGSLAALS